MIRSIRDGARSSARVASTCASAMTLAALLGRIRGGSGLAGSVGTYGSCKQRDSETVTSIVLEEHTGLSDARAALTGGTFSSATSMASVTIVVMLSAQSH